MKINYRYYLLCLSVIITICVLLADFLLMPIYVRHGQGGYMVNVKGKHLEYAMNILKSEGHKGIVSDTLFSSAFKPGIVLRKISSPL